MGNPGMSELICLLDQVSAILDLRRKRPPAPGENFSIFSVMHMENKEVDLHCRLLYELLSPDGSHGLGDRFLEAFFELVLCRPYPGGDGISVYREFAIDQGNERSGRIDLLIRGRNFCFPIEVKVYAGDQWEQVKRYARFARNAGDSQVYYLTLDGHSPSADSLGGMDCGDIRCLSFAGEIRRWLVRCGELAWEAPGVAEIIRQYLRLLDKLTGNTEEDVFMEQIKQAVSRSWASFRSAAAIEEALPLVRQEVLIRFFREIEDHMSQMEDPLPKVYSDYEESAADFYRRKSGVYPVLSYQLAECGGIRVLLTFEVDWRPAFGVSFSGQDQNGVLMECPQDPETVAGAFSDPAWREYLASHKPMTPWNLWWKYLPGDDALPGDAKNTPDFKNCRDRYGELFDPARRQALMAEIFGQIDQHIGRIRKTGLF